MHTFWALNGGQSAPAGWTVGIDLRGGLNSGFGAGSAAGAAYSSAIAAWIIVANKNVAYSTNETDWTMVRPFGQVQNAVCYGSTPNLFVSVGASGSIYTSADGKTWASQTNPLGSSVTMTGVAYSPSLNLYVAVEYGGTNIITSSNGVNWTTRTPATGCGYLLSVTWSSTLSLFLYCGLGDTTNTGSLGTSPDGINWTARTGVTSAVRYNCSTYSTSLGLFIVAGSNSGVTASKIAYSSDGITWTDVTTPGSGVAVYSLACKGTTIFSGRGGGYGYTSTNGSTWSSYTTNCSYPIRAAISATAGTFIYATDAEINLDNGYPIYLYSATSVASNIAFLTSEYLIAHEKGTIIYSTNGGVTWYFRNIGTAQRLISAAISPVSTGNKYGVISTDKVYYSSAISATYSSTSLTATLTGIHSGNQSGSLTRNIISTTSGSKIFYSSNDSMSGFSTGTYATAASYLSSLSGSGLEGSGAYYGLDGSGSLYYANGEPPSSWSLYVSDSTAKNQISDGLYAVGNAGIIKRINSAAWQSLTSGTSANLFGVYGDNANTPVRLVVGASDTIKKSTDGTTWSNVVAPSVTGVNYERVIKSSTSGTLYVAYGKTSLYEFVLVTSPDGL